MCKANRPIAKRRSQPEKPQIFVRVHGERYHRWARANISVKRGKYVYLMWREAGRVRTFYLGSKPKR